MKERNGFVSNSSSSSFVLYKKITKDEFIMDIKVIWKHLHWKHPEEVYKENLDEVSFFIAPKRMEKKAARLIINSAYQNQNWDANDKVYPFCWKKSLKTIIEKFFSPTYCDEAIKAEVFGTAQENQIPYLVLEELKSKYGKELIIHHLG